MPRAIVTSAYRTQYPLPVEFAAGESVQLGQRDSEWPQFIWATDPRGISGWVHERWLDIDDSVARATRDYSARELDAQSGEMLELIEEAGGWWWARNSAGTSGWVPTRHLHIEQEQ